MSRPTAAMIFAAGFGTRMGDLTRNVPKPMVPLGGRPMVDHAIDLLRGAGIRHIVANAHYKAEVLIPHLESRGVIITHEEGRILDTGGGLLSALPHLPDGPVITLNPDALWLGTNPIKALLQTWQAEMQALLMLVAPPDSSGRDHNGDFSLEHGEIHRNGPYTYGGAQIIRTERLAEIDGPVFSLNRYWDHLAQSGPLNGVVHQGGWHDLGNPESLAKAEQALAHV